MTTFFTADTHFNHHKIPIIGFGRPFASYEEMEEAFIANWNAVVGKHDDVWHLGDFAMVKNRAHRDNAERIFERLNGRKRLVVGNHDHEQVLRLPWAEKPVLRTQVTVDGQEFVLDHFPLASWNKMRHGTRQLYGHVHGNRKGTSASIDVGVDSWGYRPVTAAEILKVMNRLPAPVYPEVTEKEDYTFLLAQPEPEPDEPSPCAP